MPVKCEAIAKSGNRCTAAALPGGRWCLFHEPDAASLRLEGARKGGRNRATEQRARKLIPSAMPPDELAGLLALLFRGVMSSRIEPRVGTACATIAKAMLDAREATTTEERLAELEQRAGIERRTA